MTQITIAWMALPFLIGFVIYLVPKLDRPLAVAISLISAAYAIKVFTQPSPVEIQLLDHFGVTLVIDQLSGFFIITNAVVTTAVIFYCWGSDKTAFFLYAVGDPSWECECHLY
jgi:multicomponent Na+:H+ antiporter subunit D